MMFHNCFVSWYTMLNFHVSIYYHIYSNPRFSPPHATWGKNPPNLYLSKRQEVEVGAGAYSGSNSGPPLRIRVKSWSYSRCLPPLTSGSLPAPPLTLLQPGMALAHALCYNGLRAMTDNKQQGSRGQVLMGCK